MSSNIARDTLMETFRSLWACEEDDQRQRDFVIESVDVEGEKTATFSVHSSVLTMRSEMFKTMINGESSFVENKERKVKVPFSSRAVELMVKYMYGIELEDCKDPRPYFELVEISGVYGIENLNKAAAEKIKPYVKDVKLLDGRFKKETVFDLLSFAHLHKADDLKKICADEIISKFSEDEVLKLKVIIDCPEIGMELWLLFENKKKARSESRMTLSDDTVIFMPAEKMLREPAAALLKEQDQKSKTKVCSDIREFGVYICACMLSVIAGLLAGGFVFLVAYGYNELA